MKKLLTLQKKLLTLQLPFYETRAAPNGEAKRKFNAGFMLLCFVLMWFNFLVWGIVGLITAFRVMF